MPSSTYFLRLYVSKKKPRASRNTLGRSSNTPGRAVAIFSKSVRTSQVVKHESCSGGGGRKTVPSPSGPRTRRRDLVQRCVPIFVIFLVVRAIVAAPYSV